MRAKLRLEMNGLEKKNERRRITCDHKFENSAVFLFFYLLLRLKYYYKDFFNEIIIDNF